MTGGPSPPDPHVQRAPRVRTQCESSGMARGEHASGAGREPRLSGRPGVECRQAETSAAFTDRLAGRGPVGLGRVRCPGPVRAVEWGHGQADASGRQILEVEATLLIEPASAALRSTAAGAGLRNARHVEGSRHEGCPVGSDHGVRNGESAGGRGIRIAGTRREAGRHLVSRGGGGGAAPRPPAERARLKRVERCVGRGASAGSSRRGRATGRPRGPPGRGAPTCRGRVSNEVAHGVSFVVSSS